MLLVGRYHNSEAMFYYPTVYFNEQFSFFKKKKKNQCKMFFFLLEKPMQLIDFTRIVHVNVNSIFF